MHAHACCCSHVCLHFLHALHCFHCLMRALCLKTMTIPKNVLLATLADRCNLKDLGQCLKCRRPRTHAKKFKYRWGPPHKLSQAKPVLCACSCLWKAGSIVTRHASTRCMCDQLSTVPACPRYSIRRSIGDWLRRLVANPLCFSMLKEDLYVRKATRGMEFVLLLLPLMH